MAEYSGKMDSLCNREADGRGGKLVAKISGFAPAAPLVVLIAVLFWFSVW